MFIFNKNNKDLLFEKLVSELTLISSSLNSSVLSKC